MPLIPHRFLFRLAYPCRYRRDLPRPRQDRLLDLTADDRLDNFAAMDEQRNFAEVCLAWNEKGLAVQIEVKGKEKLPQGDVARPRGSDGLSLWIDTRDARAGHRGSRTCHQFHFLATGGGSEQDEPAWVQTNLHRALEDAPRAANDSILFRVHSRARGYLLETFLTTAALHGFDPEQNPRLGFFYSVRDDELGEQLLSAGPEFPFWEDPSLWSVLDLVK